MDYKSFLIKNKSQETVAEGAILPSGKVALVWLGEESTFVVYPNIESLKSIQDKIGREVYFGGFSPGGHFLTTFRLVRKEDITGVSGTGVVAYGCYFHSGAVIEWATEIPSIGYYPGGLNQIEKLHSHNGATIIEEDYTPSW